VTIQFERLEKNGYEKQSVDVVLGSSSDANQ
jgi:hypothetical protein